MWMRIKAPVTHSRIIGEGPESAGSRFMIGLKYIYVGYAF